MEDPAVGPDGTPLQSNGRARPKLSETAWVDPSATIIDSTLGRYTEIKRGSRLNGVAFGDYSYTNPFVDIAHAKIGKFVNIAGFARINPSEHPMERASLHHFMYRSTLYWTDAEDEPEIFARRAAKTVTLGHDVWLGAQAIVLAGRTMGTGSVLGAGAVLTRSTGDYEIWAGNPARKIRDRFPEPIKARLLSLAWWDWSHDRLRRTLDDFRGLSIEAFLEKHEPKQS